jgi:hypothetical protein
MVYLLSSEIGASAKYTPPGRCAMEKQSSDAWLSQEPSLQSFVLDCTVGRTLRSFPFFYGNSVFAACSVYTVRAANDGGARRQKEGLFKLS